MKMGIGLLIVLGITIQLVLLVSIFDIYFTTPIVHGISLIKNNVPPPSKRVVVISVDGLRYDALLEDDPRSQQPVAPYIRWSMAHRGAWGVSHSHLPTESRPGHVAMLAGFYEDPSAVTKGWKENPVDFDSIFNQSTCSFAWGSPDIVNIFYKDLKHNCSYKWTYDEKQDFAGNTMDLDNWVLTKLYNFFETSGNSSLYTQPSSLFFLHLLGQDTSGHTHKPHTELYRDNLRNVDRIVREVDALFGRIFRDNKTAFVLTADHGMTDWGSHGTGEPSETITPIVAWGSGIKNNKGGKQIEINQADIVPLLAILIGVPIPVNSIGILPSQFLNVSNLVVTEANLLNAQQISAQYMAKCTEVETRSPLLIYKRFTGLDKFEIESLNNLILTNIRQGRYNQANEKSKQLLQLSLEGVEFYQKYFQRPLFFLVAMTYVLWVIYLILNLHGIEKVNNKGSLHTYVFFLVLSIFISYIIFHESLPLLYHAYAQFPILLVCLIFPNFKDILLLARNVFTIKHISAASLFLLGVELLVLGFFHRWVLSIVMVAVVLWPLLDNKKLSKNIALSLLWGISGLSLGLFSILPVVGKQPHPTQNLIAAASISLAAGASVLKHGNYLEAFLRCLLVLASGFNSHWIHTSFQSQGELNIYSQCFSWALLALSFLLLAGSSSGLLEKLEIVFSSLAIPFLLLSVSHEGFFLLALFLHLACWVRLEMVNSDVIGCGTFYQQYTRRGLHEDSLTFSDLRRSYYYLTYIFTAFFGIGNLATLSSFDPAWVRCFLTTFSPFIMTALILFKVILPFFTVTVAFRVLTILVNVKPYKIFVCVLIFCNIMALNFLFLVRNEGSWLEIGTSLSHYVIQQVAIVFLLVLYFVSQIVIRPNLRPKEGKSHFL